MTVLAIKLIGDNISVCFLCRNQKSRSNAAMSQDQQRRLNSSSEQTAASHAAMQCRGMLCKYAVPSHEQERKFFPSLPYPRCNGSVGGEIALYRKAAAPTRPAAMRPDRPAVGRGMPPV